ncbi:alpha/beta hydrolase [Arcticibacterium luteifluviistationis]|uniref:Esterase n=1 Tax=Arcticibacterium luteifluviistationis TaxID=1784714 RepID=A0A2Z4G7C0_9BACT|nr:alpha/beta hydrolase [Arcticibacterium luteifluviistationis]AWV97096.1 esterase [Arcticibacterium luteifluviistationis]
MIKLSKALILLFSVFFLASCSSQKTVSDLPYIKNSKTLVKSSPKLDVYQPPKSENNPVVIFIHGGNWDAGNKDIYTFLGRNFAKKGIVSVIPNYTLSPNGSYDNMAKDVSAAIQWTSDNIAKHNGNPNEIFLMGHSAGGHLIALAGTNPKYSETANLVKGIILNDAAGLDMYSYLKENPPSKSHHYKVTWTEDEANWKDASPIYFLSEKVPPFLVYTGTKTYPSIISGNKGFVKKLNQFQPSVTIKFLPKKHVPMMRQFFFPWNRHYKEITEFIDIHK